MATSKRKLRIGFGWALAAGLAIEGAPGCARHGCEGSLSEIGQFCAASYDGTQESFSCGPNVLPAEVRRCGHLTTVLFSGGYGGLFCYYDARSAHLVGARLSSDTNEFCGNTSFFEDAGEVAPDSCFSQPALFSVDCPGREEPPTGP